MVAYRLTLKLDKVATEKAGGDMAYREVVTVVRQAFNRANVLTPVHHGNLRAHNRQRVNRVGNTTTGEIFNEAEYAEAVHNGSKAYTITPKPRAGPRRTITPTRAKALRFVVNGRVVFTRKVVQDYRPVLSFRIGGRRVYATKVHMPARKGRPWIYRAVKEVAASRGYTLTAMP